MGKENTTIISLTENIRKRLIGKDDVIRKVIICLIAQGHVLLEDVPGVGKTSLAKALADSVSVSVLSSASGTRITSSPCLS